MFTNGSRERLMYKPNQPQFFKIILGDHLRNLSIPREFVKNYGNKLSDSVILKVPSGDNWKVDIVKIDGQVCLEKGWQKFMEYYSIVNGSLVVFRYDESNSSFNVTVFDSTCTEIDYPYTFINEAAAELRVPKVESDDIPVEISGQSSPSRKRKDKSSLYSSSRPRKKMKKAEKATKVKESKENNNLTLRGKTKAIHRASSDFQSQNPTFEIKMLPSHVQHSQSAPDIPSSFAGKYMKKKEGEALLVLDGRIWSVKYSSRIKRIRFIHLGWSKFERDNHLQVGDVCKFELIDTRKTLFRVVISRGTTGATLGSSSKQSMDKKSSSILRKNPTSNFTSRNPSFEVVIRLGHLGDRRVRIPLYFIKNLQQTTQNAKLLLYGKMWDVKLLLYRNFAKGIYSIFSAGWATFARENCLKAGDVCTFELIDSRELLMKAIPRKFVKNYGNKLSNCVILKVPSGEKWKVDIVKVNGEIWLGKGWKRFMEYYSIVIGSFLVFRYDESISGFNVTIFDRTCTEIDYPYSIINEVPSEPQVPKVESVDIPVEIAARKRKNQAPLSTSRPCKKTKKLENVTKKTGKVTNTETKKEHRSSPKKMVSGIVTSKKTYSTSKEKSKGIYRASSGFQSEIPTFQITMCPSYVQPTYTYNLDIPASFARKYMTREDGDALLEVLDGRTWLVKYCTKLSCGRTRTQLMRSCWNAFSQDNHLQVGDVCKLELIDPHETLFRVVISRSTTRAILTSGSSSSKQSMDKETSIILRNTSSLNSIKAAENLTSGNPFFKVGVTSWHLKGKGVHVPSSFIKNMDRNETTQDVKLVVNGKLWNVKLLVYPNYAGNGKLCAGWSEFARRNDLKAGHVCTFELINTRDLLIKVSISRD